MEIKLSEDEVELTASKELGAAGPAHAKAQRHKRTFLSEELHTFQVDKRRGSVCNSKR